MRTALAQACRGTGRAEHNPPLGVLRVWHGQLEPLRSRKRRGICFARRFQKGKSFARLPHGRLSLHLPAFSQVALQFPDEFLKDAVAIVITLRALCPRCSFYILADTTVDVDVDFVAAAHVGADAIVHVGDSSVSRTASIPVLFIHPRRVLDLDRLTAKVAALIDPSKGVLCYFDPAYSHHFDDVLQRLHSSGVARVLIVTRRSEVPFCPPRLAWPLPITNASAPTRPQRAWFQWYPLSTLDPLSTL